MLSHDLPLSDMDPSIGRPSRRGRLSRFRRRRWLGVRVGSCRCASRTTHPHRVPPTLKRVSAWSKHVLPAVDVQLSAVDVARLLRHKEVDRVRHLHHLPQHCACRQLLPVAACVASPSRTASVACRVSPCTCGAVIWCGAPAHTAPNRERTCHSQHTLYGMARPSPHPSIPTPPADRRPPAAAHRETQQDDAARPMDGRRQPCLPRPRAQARLRCAQCYSARLRLRCSGTRVLTRVRCGALGGRTVPRRRIGMLFSTILCVPAQRHWPC